MTLKEETKDKLATNFGPVLYWETASVCYPAFINKIYEPNNANTLMDLVIFTDKGMKEEYGIKFGTGLAGCWSWPTAEYAHK